jgi:hypothetical protein
VSIVEGTVSIRADSVFVNSDFATVNVHIPLMLRKKIKEDAKNSGMTMDEFVSEIIAEKYNWYK